MIDSFEWDRRCSDVISTAPSVLTVFPSFAESSLLVYHDFQSVGTDLTSGPLVFGSLRDFLFGRSFDLAYGPDDVCLGFAVGLPVLTST